MIRIDEAGYPIWIGAGAIDSAVRLLPQGRFFLVTDANVERAGWCGRVAVGLAGRIAGRHVVPAGEASKSFESWEALLDALIEARMDRSDHVVAVGGGVVGDLAGFAAAVLKRGCGLIHVPTSLLAQADAAIGGKTAINARQGKNLVGAFHQPGAVIIDVEALATLPDRELRSGYAEIVKYGLIGDPAFFAWCERHGRAVIAGDEAARIEAVAASVRAKIRYVAGDERDQSGQRALLNFGHSFAHAIEAETEMPHGEAVALGMALAFRLSAQRGHCPDAEALRAAEHLDSVGLPTRLAGISPKRLIERMSHDKKRVGRGLRLVLVRGIGDAFVEDGIDTGQIEAFLEREIRSAGLPVG
jgi:3-dehydroquinate synthase